MWTDSHCHLPPPSDFKTEESYNYFGQSETPSLAEYLARAEEVGVKRFLNICTDIGDLPRLKKTSELHSNIYFTAGLHPHDGSKWSESHRKAFHEALEDRRCLAVGECGIDTYYENSSLEQQLQALDAQMQLALEHRKPLMIHSRESEDEMFRQLSEFKKKWGDKGVPGILHCFSGSPEFGQKCLEIGYYASFSGILTFKNAESLRNFAKNCKPSQVLVETDAPFLAPVPYRGKRCESAMMVKTAEVLAQSMGLDLKTLSRFTEENFERAFLPN